MNAAFCSMSFLRSLVEDPLGLAKGALDRTRQSEPHLARDADVGLDVVLEAPGRRVPRFLAALAQSSAHLDVHGELVERLRARDLQQIVRGQLRLLQDQL